MLPKTRSSKTAPDEAEAGSTGKQAPPANMAADRAEPAPNPQIPEDQSDHKLLLNILANQKDSDEKQETRHRNLDSKISATELTLDKYIEENDKGKMIKGNVTTNAADIQNLQASVTKLQINLTQMQNKYDATQKLLDEASANIETYAATITKLDTKFVRDEEEQLRCQLIIDRVKEQGARRPKSIVSNLLKDLQVEFAESDIKSAYRLGPINDKASRPRSIKVQFASNAFKYEIFKNIQHLKGKEMWRGVHISDAVTIEEQDCRRDMRCIYATGKSRGIDVKLRGSIIVIDGVKFTNKDIQNLPKGLSICEIKIVATKDGVAFQSHHAYLSNMYPCKIMYDGVEYK